MRILRAARLSCAAGLLLGPGCRELPDLGPGRSAPLQGPTLEVLPLDRPPLAARLRVNSEEVRLGPRVGWKATLPHPTQTWLRLEAIDPADPEGWYALDLWFAAADPPRLELPLIERRDALAPYAEMLDLFAEWVTPFNGAQIAHWSTDTLDVNIPDPSAGSLYRDTCLEAMAIWNEALDVPHLRAVENDPTAELLTRVSDELALAYTRIITRHADRTPRQLRIHLSPRWAEGSERYVRRTWLHEFAHALGLWGHSVSLRHITNGRAVVTDTLHPEEILCLRWLYSLPNGFSLAWIDRTWSSPLPGGQDAADSTDIDRPGKMVLDGPVESLQSRCPQPEGFRGLRR